MNSTKNAELPIKKVIDVMYRQGDKVIVPGKEEQSFIFWGTSRESAFDRLPWETKIAHEIFRPGIGEEPVVLVLVTEDEWENPDKYKSPGASARSKKGGNRTPRKKKQEEKPIDIPTQQTPQPQPTLVEDEKVEEDMVKVFVPSLPSDHQKYPVIVDVVAGEVPVMKVDDLCNRRLLKKGRYSARKHSVSGTVTWVVILAEDGGEYGLHLTSWARYFRPSDNPKATVVIENLV